MLGFFIKSLLWDTWAVNAFTVPYLESLFCVYYLMYLLYIKSNVHVKLIFKPCFSGEIWQIFWRDLAILSSCWVVFMLIWGVADWIIFPVHNNTYLTSLRDKLEYGNVQLLVFIQLIIAHGGLFIDQLFWVTRVAGDSLWFNIITAFFFTILINSKLF